MKKLLIAAALTASFYSFGDYINAQTFDDEGYSFSADTYFNIPEGDTSAVTAYGEVAASEKTTAAGSVGANFLNLSTEGNTLWRRIADDETDKKAVAETGTYIDTLVQFTATEEAPSTFEDGAKLAMWLQATDNGDDTATTNLYVRGLQVTSYDMDSMTPVIGSDLNYKLDTENLKVEAGTWYRLTVKAVTVFEFSGAAKIAFAIYIDGNLVKPVETAVAADWVTMFSSQLKSGVEALLSSNSLIPSSTFDTGDADTLYGVGFKGTGAIDSIAWTDDDLFPVVPAGFTLTIAMSGGVTAAEYTIGDDTFDVEGGKIAGLEADTVVTVAAKTIEGDYFAPAAQTVTVTGDATITLAGVAFADVPTTGDAAITDDNKNTILEWAKTGGNNAAQVEAAAARGYLSDSYTLNVADLSAEPEIEIVSIVPGDGTTAATVTAKVTVNGVTRIENLSSATFNGGATLKYKAATTLSGLDAAEAETEIPATTGGSQFIKVVVE